jgi:hypothetical protein
MVLLSERARRLGLLGVARRLRRGGRLRRVIGSETVEILVGKIGGERPHRLREPPAGAELIERQNDVSRSLARQRRRLGDLRSAAETMAGGARLGLAATGLSVGGQSLPRLGKRQHRRQRQQRGAAATPRRRPCQAHDLAVFELA